MTSESVLKIHGTLIPYRVVIRSNAKNVTLRMNADLTLRVTVPPYIRYEELDTILREKTDWIWKAREETRLRLEALPRHSFAENDCIPVLGEPQTLHIHASNKQSVTITWHRTDQSFEVTVPPEWVDASYSQTLYEAFTEWFKQFGKRHATERLQEYGTRMGRLPKKLVLRSQTSRWGSCSSDGTIALNWRLFLGPREIVDYVIVHELAHLFHMNHSDAFWATVEDILPDYKVRRQWLREHGQLLDLHRDRPSP
ncbi:MAG: SprT family zinc-dependent metalloprotease [Alicyclobacillaceae bacterium]|nr:SprT family zinc-dependent metalloprotease [Alicyclobacillaceae bacterium]